MGLNRIYFPKSSCISLRYFDYIESNTHTQTYTHTHIHKNMNTHDSIPLLKVLYLSLGVFPTSAVTKIRHEPDS